MTKIFVGPTGNVIRGDVMDVSKREFDRQLKDYDNLLYSTWNPAKRKGMGCWEIRRRPAEPSHVYRGEFNGMELYEFKYVESPLVHHVLDTSCLNYSVISKIKSMDMWTVMEEEGVTSINKALDYRSQKHEEKVKEKGKEDLRYHIKQNKKIFREWKEMLASGQNPHDVFRYWGK